MCALVNIDVPSTFQDSTLIGYAFVRCECDRIHQLCPNSASYAMPYIRTLRDKNWYRCQFDPSHVGEVETETDHQHGRFRFIDRPTTIAEAAGSYLGLRDRLRNESPECYESIEGAIAAIRRNNVWPVFLKWDGVKLLQIDGLHRMIAYVISDKRPENLVAYVGDDSGG